MYEAALAKLGLTATYQAATHPAAASPPRSPARPPYPLAANGLLLDMAGISNASHAPIQAGAGQTLDYANMILRNAPRSYFLVFPGGSTHIDGCYFGHFGQNTDVTDHGEIAQARGGSVYMRRSIVNLLDGHDAQGGASGGFQFQSDVAPFFGLIDGCALLGNGTAGSHNTNGTRSNGIPAFSLKAVNYDCILAVRNTGVEADATGRRVVKTALNGFKCVVLDLGGNFDPLTLQPVTL